MKGILFKPWKAKAIRSMGPDRDWQTRRVEGVTVGDKPNKEGDR